MAYPTSAQNAEPNNTSLKKDAEKAFLEFLQQMNKKQSNGFISNTENGDIFSFETYLRELGTSSEITQAYCNHVKAVNGLESSVKKMHRNNFWANNKVLSQASVGLVMVSMLLFVLVAAFFSTFDISLWNGKVFSLFVFPLPVLFWITTAIKYKAAIWTFNKEEKNVRFIIKYFDNDELTFTKAKSRLFKE